MKTKFWVEFSGDVDEIVDRLKQERDAKVTRKLILINLIAHGFDINEAAALIGIKIRIAYTWANQWLKKGYLGLLPKKRIKRPPKLDNEQKKKLKEMLHNKEYWTLKEIKKLIKHEFGVEYKKSRIYELIRGIGLKLSKPYVLHVNRPDDAIEILKMRLEKVLAVISESGYEMGDIIIGFFDESSPQLSPNTARLWSFKKLKLKRITTKQKKRANTFGFYAINGNNVVCFQEKSKKENVIEVLRMIRDNNKEKPIFETFLIKLFLKGYYR